MDRRKVVILGAGISGLSCAWFLSKFSPESEIILLEKAQRAGGWIHTDDSSGFHFEKGPRTFLASKTEAILSLIAELGIGDQVIVSENRPYKRYLWFQGKLHKFPTHPLEFFVSPLTRGFVKALFSEWKKPSFSGDESVFEFAKRRFNEEVASLFFDPMVVGIFGGDSRYISVKSCFPQLKKWEETYGSVTAGFWKQFKEKKTTPLPITGLKSSAIYSLQTGLQGLIDALTEQLTGTLRFNTAPTHLEKRGEKWEISLEGGDKLFCDQLFSALPLSEMIPLFTHLAPDLISPLSQIPSTTVVVVSVGFRRAVLPVEGFGYLSQVTSEESILGVVFDSSVFPQHNRRPGETRLTLKLKDQGLSEAEYIKIALAGLKTHLGITDTPDAISFKYAKEAIPQYDVGYLDRMAEFEKAFEERVPDCHLLGNYLSGVSVNSCIERAKAVAQRQTGCPASLRGSPNT